MIVADSTIPTLSIVGVTGVVGVLGSKLGSD